jgi:glucosamine-6-phosphate deaminase
MKLKLLIMKSSEEFNREAAAGIADVIRSNPTAVLGLATGSTPIGVYRQLIEMNKRNQVDFSQVTTFNLDEYYPIRPEHPQSYFSYMKNYLFDHVNIDPNHTHIPRGDVTDVKAHCQEYERSIQQAGGIDLQLLGIGRNGHIGFNEPGTRFEQTSHVVKLADQTIKDNARFFEENDLMPKQAITMGIKTIMQSKRILLLANGLKKAQALKNALYGPVTPQVPASVLQLHPNVTIITDREAASMLPDGFTSETVK